MGNTQIKNIMFFINKKYKPNKFIYLKTLSMGKHRYPKGITIKENENVLINKKRLLDWLNTFGSEWIELIIQSDGIPDSNKKHFIIK